MCVHKSSSDIPGLAASDAHEGYNILGCLKANFAEFGARANELLSNFITKLYSVKIFKFQVMKNVLETITGKVRVLFVYREFRTINILISN